LVAVPSVGRATEVTPQRAAPEADATRDLYERYARQIYAYCFHQLGNREEAEDATQSTFLNAFRGLKRGVDPEFETAWLYKIAQNVCLTRQRSSSRRRRLESPGDLEAMQDYVPAHQPDSDELIHLPEALDAMPEQQRRALLLREWQGLSYKEIADELGLSQPAVETLLFRARRTLAASLSDEPAAKKSIAKKLQKGSDAGSAAALVKTLLLSGSAKVAATVATVAATSVVVAAPATRHAVEDVVAPRHDIVPVHHAVAAAQHVATPASHVVSPRAVRTPVAPPPVHAVRHARSHRLVATHVHQLALPRHVVQFDAHAPAPAAPATQPAATPPADSAPAAPAPVAPAPAPAPADPSAPAPPAADGHPVVTPASSAPPARPSTGRHHDPSPTQPSEPQPRNEQAPGAPTANLAPAPAPAAATGDSVKGRGRGRENVNRAPQSAPAPAAPTEPTVPVAAPTVPTPSSTTPAPTATTPDPAATTPQPAPTDPSATDNATGHGDHGRGQGRRK
jgi:RNA polymerase sigma factor (sigma-70 family)